MKSSLRIGARPLDRHPSDEKKSLFERFPWLYAICRDHLFRDDTKRMANALWLTGVPPAGSELLEVGCGPGFYARRLAESFEQLRVTGVDISERQLHRARTLAAAERLDNCVFERGDARTLPAPDAAFDAVITSRLFIILPERQQALAEMHRVLKPGGRCFIAEPRSALRAMWLLAGLTAILGGGGQPTVYREPADISVMDTGEFGGLVESQPWSFTRRWHDVWYQYALCEKDAG